MYYMSACYHKAERSAS